MNFQLLSKSEAVNILAKIASYNLPLVIEVTEDICFKNQKGDCQWITLGEIRLEPIRGERTQSGADERVLELQRGIQLGAYKWYIPTKESLNEHIKQTLTEVLKDHKESDKEPTIDQIQKYFHQGFQDIVRRLLLLLPTFDPDALCRMPLKRPTTIVPDTSAVYQGALNFTARFLSPMARIKIPAVVHMEIEDRMEKYFRGIRWNRGNLGKPELHPGALMNHLLSQGGQRTLLRLELHSEAEMDRGSLGIDPIRGIIQQPGSDPEDKNLRLTGVVKSFADRLILETARLHRSQVRPDHPLILLTSDQGLARMAMAEGVDVFFFQARKTPEPCGEILSGALFHPFEDEFYTVPLTDVLWEFAVSFGGARIKTSNQDFYLEIWALGGSEELTWHPLHAKNDLIWGSYQLESKERSPTIQKSEVSKATGKRFTAKGYKFTPFRMLDLIGELVDKGNLSVNEIHQLLSVKTAATLQRYIRFLRSGKLIIESADLIEATDIIRELWKALNERDLTAIHELFSVVPSYYEFCRSVYEFRQLDIDADEIPISKSALPDYITIAEMAGAILSIPRTGIVATDKKPDVKDFAECAIACYNDVISSQESEEWILTGAWLECLALKFAIHPLRARSLLHKSKEEGVLNFSLQGSTPDTRFRDHTMSMLEIDQGQPVLRKVFLYEGGFIHPGVAGVRIKIVGRE